MAPSRAGRAAHFARHPARSAASGLPGYARRAARRYGEYIARAPGTHAWLFLLAVNTFLLERLSAPDRHYFLTHHSTNLAELHHHPVTVLVASAFWTETPSFGTWFVAFNLFLVPVERWLGTLRWLLVVFSAHVLATLISEGAVHYGVDHGLLPHAYRHVIDIGVSYGVAGAIGVLTWRFVSPWRWIYLSGALVYYLVPLLLNRTFTDLGHFSALLIGLSAFPFAHGRPHWDPAPTVRAVRLRLIRLSGIRSNSPSP